MPKLIKKATDIEPGEFYEDAFYHPCVCVNRDHNSVVGISLIDGSYPRMAEFDVFDIRKLTLEEVVHWKFKGPEGDDVSEIKDKWWLGKLDPKSLFDLND